MALLRLLLILVLSGCSFEPLTREELFGLPSVLPKVRVTGTVSNMATGAPIQGVTVNIASVSAQSDGAGVFVLEGLAIGEFPASALKEGYARRDFSVRLADGTNSINLQLTCTTCARVFGVARDSVTNAPLADVSVSIGGVAATSDATGAYELPGLGEGMLTGSAVKQGYDRADFTVTVRAPSTTYDVVLTGRPCGGCTSGLVCNVVLGQCQQPATVTFAVLDACTGAGISARLVSQGKASCSTQGRGFAMLSGLAPGGPHTLAIGKTGYKSSSSMVTLMPGFNALPDVHLERVLDCAAPLTDEPCTCTTPECQ